MLSFDPVTRQEHDAAVTTTAKAQAVVAALANPVTVKIKNASGTVVATGSMNTPWATVASNVLTIGTATGFTVTTGGTPDPLTWRLRFESGTRWIEGSFGLSNQTADFKWSLATFEASQVAQFQNAGATTYKGTVQNDVVDNFNINAAVITFGWKPEVLVGTPYVLGDSQVGTEYRYDLDTLINNPQSVPRTLTLVSAIPGIQLDGISGELIKTASVTAGTYDVQVGLAETVVSNPLNNTLTLTGTGTDVPYISTFYPVEAAIPAGSTITSVDDPNLRGTVLSTWPDGSAQVVVLAGRTNISGTKTIALSSAVISEPSLTLQAIKDAVSTITTNFGTTQTLTLATAIPDWVWWANSQVICARYRLATGLGSIEAVIDIHAFPNNKAFVEVVVENGKVNADASTVSPPTIQTYTNATVSVNGTVIATVSSPTAGMAIPRCRRSIQTGSTQTYSQTTNGHEPGRAWYCSTWVNVPAPLQVTHDTTSLKSVPFFFGSAVASAENLQTKYTQSYDTYEPWATCRLRIPGLATAGDDQELAAYSMTQSDYIVSGNRFAQAAVLATTKAALSTHISYRHTDGRVPLPSQSNGKSAYSTPATWPASPYTNPTFTNNASHIPSMGVVAFLCQPSPFIIELVQKFATFRATEYGPGLTPTTYGAHNFEQPRSRAWMLRTYGQAILLTPDNDPTSPSTPTARKAGYRQWLYNSVSLYEQGLKQSWNPYNIYLGATVANGGDVYDASINNPVMAGVQESWFMVNFNGIASHQVASMKPLRGSEQTLLNTHADGFANAHIKWLMDATSYEWRTIPYVFTVGTGVGGTGPWSSLDPGHGNLATYLKADHAGTPYTSPGPWKVDPVGNTSFDLISDSNTAVGNPTMNVNEPTYGTQFFAALVAAVERGVPNADTAWTKVYGTNGSNGGISNLLTWRNGMAYCPHWNYWPRNKP